MFLPTSKPNQKHHLKIPGSSSQLGPIKNLNITAYFASSCLLPPPIQYRSSPQRHNQTRKRKIFTLIFVLPLLIFFVRLCNEGLYCLFTNKPKSFALFSFILCCIVAVEFWGGGVDLGDMVIFDCLGLFWVCGYLVFGVYENLVC